MAKYEQPTFLVFPKKVIFTNIFLYLRDVELKSVKTSVNKDFSEILLRNLGSMDSSECSDLVGLYILAELSKFIDKDSFGLYKDDGLLAIKDSAPNKWKS